MKKLYKIYFLIGEIRDLGSKLENVIFLELKRRNYEIYIGKNGNTEVDFVITNNDASSSIF